MTTEFPAATLRIECLRDDRFTIHLTSTLPGVADEHIPCDGYHKLRRMYGEARDTLEKSTLSGNLVLDQDGRDAAKILNDIRGLGRSFLGTMMGRLVCPATARFRTFFTSVSTAMPGGVAPVLTFDSPVDLPLELIPALWDDNLIVPADPLGIFDQCVSRFLGVRFVIHRYGQSFRSLPRERKLRTRGTADAVPLAPYWNEKVTKVRDELVTLACLDHLEVRPARPDRASVAEESAPHDLAALLIRDRVDREEIVHIAAHCEAPLDEPTGNHAIVFGARTRWKTVHTVRVSVLDLLNAEDTSLERTDDLPDGPLAFINACRAANLTFRSYTSIPEVLLNARYRAVVSPLVSVQAGPATRMAQYFYQALGERYTVGGALRRARVNLLKIHANPLGLAYCCHGESRLHLPPLA